MGIFPYVLKLLQSSARELRPLLVFIWAKILAVDSVSSPCPPRGREPWRVSLGASSQGVAAESGQGHRGSRGGWQGQGGPAKELVLRPGLLAHPRRPGSVCEQRRSFPREKWTGRPVGAGTSHPVPWGTLWPSRSPLPVLSAVLPSRPGEGQWPQVLPVGAGRPLHAGEALLCGGRCVVGPLACSAGTAWRAQGRCPPPPPSWGPLSGGRAHAAAPALLQPFTSARSFAAAQRL